MSELVQNANGIDGILLGIEGSEVGIFSGGTLPHVAVPDAPFPSTYHRTDGVSYKLVGNPSLSTGWALLDQASGSVPFCNSDGTEDNFSLVSNEIPFQNSDGSTDNLPLV